jgi:hypothetical protein
VPDICGVQFAPPSLEVSIVPLSPTATHTLVVGHATALRDAVEELPELDTPAAASGPAVLAPAVGRAATEGIKSTTSATIHRLPHLLMPLDPPRGS